MFSDFCSIRFWWKLLDNCSTCIHATVINIAFEGEHDFDDANSVLQCVCFVLYFCRIQRDLQNQIAKSQYGWSDLGCGRWMRRCHHPDACVFLFHEKKKTKKGKRKNDRSLRCVFQSALWDFRNFLIGFWIFQVLFRQLKKFGLFLLQNISFKICNEKWERAPKQVLITRTWLKLPQVR